MDNEVDSIEFYKESIKEHFFPILKGFIDAESSQYFKWKTR